MTEPTENKVRSMAIQMSSYEPLAATEKEDRKGWVSYGNDNLYPNYLIGLYYNSPIHNALTNRISSMIQGKGSNTILDNALKGIAFDLKLQGQFVAEVIWNIDGTRVAKINHLPFENCRLAYGERDEVIGVWYSRDWTKIKHKKYEPKFIAKFNPSRSKECPNQCIYSRIATSGSLWYAKPDYYGALNYIELSHQMSLYHVNNILNGLFPSFIISMMNGIPTQEERTLIKNEWERKIAGAQNAGKFLMTFNEPNSTAPNITPFPISDADKQYEFLSEETAKQIMVAHSVTSPLLFGIRDNTGFGSNKDEMIVALDIFNHQVIQPYQRLICDAFEAILPNVSIELNSPFSEATTSVAVQQSEKKKTNLEIPTSFEPTKEMANEAELGLKWRGEFNRGGTEIGIARARDISNLRNLSYDTVTRMNSYFSRHEVDKLADGWNLGEDGFPSAGRIAWQLWGGDAGQLWAKNIVEKYKTEQSLQAPEFTQEAEQSWINRLSDKAEYIDENEWECIAEEEVHDTDSEKQVFAQFLSERQYANADEKSAWGDTGLYKLRYQYSQNISEHSREFCKTMVGLSKAGALFRYEDITTMSDDGVNGQFAPEGQSTYDIFKWKGGAFCHHSWKRKIYVRKRDSKGRILPNDGLKNDKLVGNVPYVKRKGEEGIAPIDTPSRGSLKYS